MRQQQQISKNTKDIEKLEYTVLHTPDSIETLKELSRGTFEGTTNLLEKFALILHDIDKIKRNIVKLKETQDKILKVINNES